MARAGLAVLCLLAGAASGLASVVLHTEPWGLVLGVGAGALGAAALPPTWWARVAFCWAWAAVVLRLALARPEGDYLIIADTDGYVLLVAALVLAVAGSAGLARGRR
ncbi:MAG: hypothetical protein ACR2JD_04505 [Nocardioides sp.]